MVEQRHAVQQVFRKELRPKRVPSLHKSFEYIAFDINIISATCNHIDVGAILKQQHHSLYVGRLNRYKQRREPGHRSQRGDQEKFERLLTLVKFNGQFAEIGANVLQWSLETLACGGHIETFKAILTSGRLNMDKLGNEGSKLASLAIDCDQPEALDLLLETISSTMGSTPQQVNDYSVYAHGVATAQANLHNRTNPNDTYSYIVSILLKAGARVEVVDNNRRTPFFLAVTGSLPLEHLEFWGVYKGMTVDRAKFPENLKNQRMAIATATVLLEHGANVHHKDAMGRNALSYVAASFLPELTQFLIDKGIDLDNVDAKGRTALSHACEIGSTKAVRLLIKAGCDVYKPDKADRGNDKPIGYTPLHYAEAWYDAVGLIYGERE
ncbi:ankyrin repeat-containing domain protein [Aspergillus filifer]